MADETFEIGLKVTGEDKAARAFENLKLRQLEASQEATKLAAELRRLQQSGTASAEEIEAAARALIRARQGAAEYGRQASQVQRAMAAQAHATRQTTTATNAQTTAAVRATAAARTQAVTAVGLGQKWGQVAGALGNVGTVIGTVSPQMGRFGGIIGSVGSASGALAGAMGPLGVAIAGITTVIGLASAAWNLYEESTRDAAKATVDATLTVEQAAAARARQAVTESRARLMRLRTEGTDEDYAREAANLRALEASYESIMQPIRERQRLTEQLAQEDRDRAVRQRQEAEAAGENARVMAEINATMAEIDAAEARRTAAAAAHNALLAERQRLDQASEDQANAFHQNALARIAELTEELERTGDILDPTARAAADARIALEGTFSGLAREDAEKARASASQRADARRGIARTGGDMGADLAEFRAFVAAQGDMDAERTQRYQDALHAREDAHRAHILALRDLEASGTDWTAEQFNRRLALHQEMIAQQRADEAAAAERTKELAAITNGMWDSIGGTVTDAAGQMFKFLISGAEGGSDAFLAMLDSFLEATSVEYTIKALGEAANAVAAAARQDYAAAAQHGVAAGMAAAVAAATGLASAAISVPSTGAGAGAPPQVGAGAQSGGTTNITIQLYAPQAVFTEAERGELIARGVREAERVRPGSARF